MHGKTLYMASYALQRKYDPTRTTVLRNAFARDMRIRFNELIQVIVKAVFTQDCFGLNRVQVFQLTAPGEQAFAFPRSAEKLEAFMVWLKEQERRGLITTGELQQVGSSIEAAWTNLYVFDSYKRGVIRARYELQKAGYKVPSIEDSGGIEIAMGNPFHLERVGLLYARVYEELKGITAAMDTQISRVLAQGMADGDGPRLLARKLVAVIDGAKMGELGITDSLGRFIPAKRRAEMLARTEMIRAHHLATIQEYRNWAVAGVRVDAEIVTAGDTRVCDKCQGMEGKIYTLDQIEGMIPFHTCCRCMALPINIINPNMPIMQND
jgi:SPP1 gp7 family putative phage head morphogenesis protein